ncbi:MAG: hypothetical protein A3F24_00940 [Candidatus Colwellbacteria bacterium RIFCSPHIGHO2_12_FULL_44_17]|uniref:Peptidoglycan binding-like domain-containing protein n=2 Tax=Candidatus Colwelliibacteriota TaxID=1817904 RepID=A0A1G1Z4Q1_9BACT|nr:MAG: hypothetical protein A3I31_01235 [Candidatus Colwellbacteria bacterium RIFCSPLOWO2_02_FULL_44_20b]OGY60271.1 MAG: hypothetical protein A3F24_00940 [Candidatus Colwellbacteria bacterium RIFCSPHIGHO2_12_FULL_44_17]
MIQRKVKLAFAFPLIVVLGVLLSASVSAQALSFTSATTVTINSNNYSISSGSAATSMIVGALTLEVVVPASSTFTLTSSDRYRLNNDQNISQQCSVSQNSLSVTGPLTIIITPDATSLCALASSGGGGGGGGGGPVTDTTAPTGTSVSVNNGAAKTTTVAVTLTLGATGASDVLLSNDSNFTGAVWIVYGTSKSWMLSSSNGVKTVYAKFRDNAGNVSAVISDTITLDPTASTSETAAQTTTTTPSTTTTTPSTTTSVTLKPLPYASPKTNDEMRANLAVLLENLAALQAQVAAPQGSGSVSAPASAKPASGKYSKALTVGSKGDDVTALQEFLKSQGTDIYPEGLVTGYYGGLTKAAVGRFQMKQGIVTSVSDPGYGYVGPKTRAKLNSLLGL